MFNIRTYDTVFVLRWQPKHLTERERIKCDVPSCAHVCTPQYILK